MEISFTVALKQLKQSLNNIKLQTPKFSKKLSIWISITEDRILISAPSVKEHINAKTNGKGNVNIPLIILNGYVKTTKSTEITFSFKEGELSCGNSFFTSPEIHVSKVI